MKSTKIVGLLAAARIVETTSFADEANVDARAFLRLHMDTAAQGVFDQALNQVEAVLSAMSPEAREQARPLSVLPGVPGGRSVGVVVKGARGIRNGVA